MERAQAGAGTAVRRACSEPAPDGEEAGRADAEERTDEEPGMVGRGGGSASAEKADPSSTRHDETARSVTRIESNYREAMRNRTIPSPE